MLEGAARRGAATDLAVAQPADGERTRTVLREAGHELREQRLEPLALVVVQHGEQLAQGRAAIREHRGGRAPSRSGEMQRPRAPVSPGTPPSEPVAHQPVDDLDRGGLGHPEDVGEPLDGPAGMGVEVNERPCVGATSAEPALDRPAKAVGGGERQGAKQLREAIGHTQSITKLCAAKHPSPEAIIQGVMELTLVTVVVEEYDAAIEFFVDRLGFELVEDSPALTTEGGRPKRWVVVRPPGAQTGLLLARAEPGPQTEAIGNQVAGRVGFFLRVDDFEAAYERMRAAGVEFTGPPRTEPYGRVAVFLDVAGNRWDLLGPA